MLLLLNHMNIYSESIWRILTTDTIIYHLEDGKIKPQRLNRYEATPMKHHSSQLQANVWSEWVFPLEFPNSLSNTLLWFPMVLLENNIFSPNYYGSIKNSKWVREDMMKYKCRVLRMLMPSVDSSKAGHFN